MCCCFLDRKSGQVEYDSSLLASSSVSDYCTSRGSLGLFTLQVSDWLLVFFGTSRIVKHGWTTDD